MRIVGLFIVVFTCAAINKWLFSSDIASTIGMVIGAGAWIILTENG